MKIKDILKIIKEIKELPKTTLTIIGKENKDIYKRFNKIHPKYIIIKAKTIGMCLMEKPESLDDYLKGKPKQIMRTNRSKALKNGFYFKEFDIKEYANQVLVINTSKDNRQGRKMNKSYSDINDLVTVAEGSRTFGVFSKEGILVCYCYLKIVGDFAIFNRILGDADAMDYGIMYLMTSGIVEEWIKENLGDGIKYLSYDMWFGGSEGLKNFKKRLGFMPYMVKYKYTD